MLKGARLIDCTIFFNELELLEIRLHELDELVDTFVIVEATHTHQGDPKPLIFEENRGLFEKFLPKIKHFAVSFPDNMELPAVTDAKSQVPMAREKHQRNSLSRALSAPNDIMILSDVDEIPSAQSIRNYTPGMGIAALPMDSFYYWFNMKVGEWTHARILPVHAIKGATLDTIRQEHCPVTVPGPPGWHYSYMGGPERIVEKFNSFSHVGYSHIPKREGEKTSTEEMRTHLDEVFQSIGQPGMCRQWHNSFPQYVEDNKARYITQDFIRLPQN